MTYKLTMEQTVDFYAAIIRGQEKKIAELKAEIVRLQDILESRNREGEHNLSLSAMANEILHGFPCAFGCGREATVHTSSDDFVCIECRDGFEAALAEGDANDQHG